jgi:hypothetical protein
MQVFEEMKNRWPSTVVRRQLIGQFTGGMIGARHLANMDSQGRGPAVRVKVGKNVGYPVDALIQWLEQHVKIQAEG